MTYSDAGPKHLDLRASHQVSRRKIYRRRDDVYIARVEDETNSANIKGDAEWGLADHH